MPTVAEKEESLLGMIENITGDAKNKETGAYIKVLRGRRNKNYPNAEIAICKEGFEELLATVPYGWTDKQGRQWIPVRLKIWDAKKEEVIPPQPIKDDTDPFGED